MYGTQIFQPFAATRVAWSTIAVADPLFTVPFLVAVVALSRQSVGSRRRLWWHRAGWVWGLAYLSLTVGNKLHVDAVLQDSLREAAIPAVRHVSNPTILNNVLWSATAETADAFYLTQYSILDSSPPVWTRLDKDPAWFAAHAGDPVLETLQWFSDGLLYKTPGQLPDGAWQLSDLRFGSFTGRGDNPDDLIFRFQVGEAPSGELLFLGAEGGPKEGEETNFFPALWQRMKGR
jgi:inner membrane protein